MRDGGCGGGGQQVYRRDKLFSPRAPRMLGAALGLALALGAVVTARTADACQPPSAYVWSRATLPLDGAVDVPLNARVMVVYDARYMFAHPEPAPSFDALTVSTAAGDAVAGTVTVTTGVSTTAVIFVPSEPLAPGTVYEVRDGIQLGMFNDGIAEAPSVIVTFTTGTTLDTEAPAQPPELVVTYGCDACANDACCGPYSARTYGVDWGATPDGVMVEVATERETVWAIEERGGGFLDSAYYPQATLLRSEGALAVTFVDVAGNASEPRAVAVDAPGCSSGDPGPEVSEEAEPQPEAADTGGAEDVSGTPDEGAADTGAQEGTRDADDGCASGAAGSVWAAGLALALATWRVVRRGRAPRARVSAGRGGVPRR